MYGEDNNYYQYLIDLYNGSPTNHACINGISEMIYGKGLMLQILILNLMNIQMIALLKKDVVRKVIYDYYLMGAAYKLYMVKVERRLCNQNTYQLRH